MKHTVRRVAAMLAVGSAAAFAVMNPGIVKAFYDGLYPSDTGKRLALELCFMRDHKFNRLDPVERDTCYQRMLPQLGEAGPKPADQPALNLIDLRRDAGRGSVPRNDIIRLEQNQNPPHAPY